MEDRRTVVEVDVDESGVSVGGSVGVVAFSTVGGEDLKRGRRRKKDEVSEIVRTAKRKER